ncbi:MAG TPA: hypothetical protein VK918_02735 [Pyrinomonadaceae bacterium]|nr:hypothetical protein [Pyrinomonadaceae bacterium]
MSLSPAGAGVPHTYGPSLSTSISTSYHSAFFNAEIAFEEAGPEGFGGDVKGEATDRFDEAESGFSLVDDLFGGGLFENGADVVGACANHGVKIAVADGGDERQVTGTEQLERIDQLTGTLFVDYVGEDNDERPLFGV